MTTAPIDQPNDRPNPQATAAKTAKGGTGSKKFVPADGVISSEGKNTKCGFIALVGPTNAGKSTLVNALTGHKVSIVSRKVQTTRTRVLGIAMHEKGDDVAQLIFIDTPGLFKPKKRLDRAMIQAAETGMQEADRIILLVDASKPPHVVVQEAKESIAALQRAAPDKPICLAFNKIDKIAKDRLLEMTVNATAGEELDEVFMISAHKGDGLAAIMDYCLDGVDDAPFMYPEDEISIMPFRLMAAEITREVVMDLVHQEIPYAVTVVTETVEAFDNGDYKLGQVIVVEKASQKTVLVGRAGSKIKQIGMSARIQMEQVFEVEGKIHLNLFVKVQANWQSDPEYYALWNLEGHR